MSRGNPKTELCFANECRSLNVSPVSKVAKIRSCVLETLTLELKYFVAELEKASSEVGEESKSTS